MLKKLKRINREFVLFLSKKPLFYVLFLFAIILVARIVINVYRQQPILANFEDTLSIFCTLFIGYLASVLSKKTGQQFLLCFLFTFIYLVIQSFIEKSIVDYTSFLLLTFFSILLGGISWILARSFTSIRIGER